jgi:saccharopine dehydrogenase-like NADP-dependent oxidoreductase
MSCDVLILGGTGMQGRIAARDLLEHGHTIVLADLRKEGIETMLAGLGSMEFEFIDLRDEAAGIALIKHVDPRVVLNCAEGDWNMNVYRASLTAGKSVLDLGSDIPMTIEQLNLHSAFEQAGLVAITGCGSTPGVNNIMLHHAHQLFDRLDTIEAGFAWDSNIKKFVVPFSIPSIIEEFTFPAAVVENGQIVMKTPLENIEERTFREIGTQECFPVRHPETHTFYEYNKKDGLSNVRFYAGFPKHSADVIRAFIDTGFGNDQKINVYGQEVSPRDVLTETLRNLPIPDGYREKENLWVHVWGQKEGNPHEILMECIVDTLDGWESAGCNIDTGIPASIMTRMVLDGRIVARGSYPPGRVVPASEFFVELAKYKMKVYENGKELN